MTDKKKRICLACGRVIAHPAPTQKYHMTYKCQSMRNIAKTVKYQAKKRHDRSTT